jgi:hypothetical protein
MWGSLSLMTVSTAVKTVLHFAEVVHTPHESWPSWIAGYSLYRQAPLHTFGVCARTSLHGCWMVSPSLQHTRWGFTRGVCLHHQGPPLAPCGSQEIPLLYPLVPNQTDLKSLAQSTPPVGTSRLDSTTYYVRPYLYRLMVVLFSWVAAPWIRP